MKARPITAREKQIPSEVGIQDVADALFDAASNYGRMIGPLVGPRPTHSIVNSEGACSVVACVLGATSP